MITYKMQFIAKIESVDPDKKCMVVEYFDPHGNDSLRRAISFGYDSTPEHLNQLIIDNTPHSFFHARHMELEAIKNQNIDYTPLLAMVGSTIDYKLPTFDNEII